MLKLLNVETNHEEVVSTPFRSCLPNKIKEVKMTTLSDRIWLDGNVKPKPRLFHGIADWFCSQQRLILWALRDQLNRATGPSLHLLCAEA